MNFLNVFIYVLEESFTHLSMPVDAVYVAMFPHYCQTSSLSHSKAKGPYWVQGKRPTGGLFASNTRRYASLVYMKWFHYFPLLYFPQE